MPHGKTTKNQLEVERIFRVILPENGLTVRKEQILLCHDMLDGLLHNTISLCDAGVGIGKTYAYLVACILTRKYSLCLNRPIVISTSSVALQDAIIGEYLPFLSNVLLSGGIIDEPLTAHLRKGKERFVCDERFIQRLRAVTGKKKNAEQFAALNSLMLHYDLDTVTGLSEFDRRQVCVPKVCPKTCVRKDTCRYHIYLRQVQTGTGMIQICNHNYLLADAEHRQQGFHPLLKEYGILVVDEAHKYAKTMAQIEDEAETAKRIKEYYRQFCGWAEEFEMASTARKRVILSELLEKVEVGKGYQVTIRLKMSYQQFLDLCAPEDQPKNTLTKSHDEEVA